jgi:hypothetical protein
MSLYFSRYSLGAWYGAWGGGEGKVEEERDHGIVAADQLDRILAQQSGHVALFLDRPVVTEPIPLPVSQVGEIIDLAE